MGGKADPRSLIRTSLPPLEPTIEGAADGFLIDRDGRQYFDLWCDGGVASLGHTDLRRAIECFMVNSTQAVHVSNGYNVPERTATADRLTAFCGMDRVFFANSGTEANEAAIKLARRYHHIKGEPGRKVILSLPDQLHGRTGFSLAATQTNATPYYKQGFGPFASGFYMAEQDLETYHLHTTPSEVPSDARFLINWPDIAALIMSPVLTHNQMRFYGPVFWSRLSELRAKHGFLVIFDEVQSGMGRTGYPCAWMNPAVTDVSGERFKPDILTLAKGLAMGIPAGACLATEEASKGFEPGTHFSTFGGNLLAGYLINWLIDGLERGVLENVRNCETILRNGFACRRWVDKAEGTGLVWSLTPKWGDSDAFAFRDRAMEEGLLLMAHLPHRPLRICPPLNSPPELMEQALARLDRAASRCFGGQP